MSGDDLEIRWRAQIEMMIDEPDHWITRRWRLHQLKADPSDDFKRECLRLLDAAGDQRHPHIKAMHYLVIDRLVSDERMRQASARAASLPISDDEIADGPLPARGIGLTRTDVLKHRRAWQSNGPPSPWVRAGVSKATYIRHRSKHGLVPWPEGYQRRLTP